MRRRPLDVVANVDLYSYGGEGTIAPPTDGYVDTVLTFTTDRATMHYIEIRARSGYGTTSYHVDDVRIARS